MANNRFGSRSGSGDDRGRGRGDYDYADRERDRERSRHGSDRGSERERDEDRGFFERAGNEIRSWFGGDEDEVDRGGRYGSSRGNFGRDQDRGERDYGRHYDRLSQERGGSRGRVQSWGEANRGDWEGGRQSSSGGRSRKAEVSEGFEDFHGTLGGFGNQQFGSTLDDHYRSWRDRQMAELDRDYQDYCRERERQFHEDFGSWRQNRRGGQDGGSGQFGDTEDQAKQSAGVTGETGQRQTTGAENKQESGSTGSGQSGGKSETSGSGASGRGSRSRS